MSNKYGFTLLEILIALFIFSIISLIMTRALNTVLTAQTRTAESSTQFAQLNLAISLIANDLEQAIDRPINVNTTIENSFIGTDTSVTLTHAGWSNPQGQENHPTLQRSRFFLAKKQLIRTTWPVLDQTQYTQSANRTLLSGVSRLKFEYLDKNNQYQHRWNEKELPRAVKISFNLEKLGQFSQVYPIPGR